MYQSASEHQLRGGHRPRSCKKIDHGCCENTLRGKKLRPFSHRGCSGNEIVISCPQKVLATQLQRYDLFLKHTVVVSSNDGSSRKLRVTKKRLSQVVSRYRTSALRIRRGKYSSYEKGCRAPCHSSSAGTLKLKLYLGASEGVYCLWTAAQTTPFPRQVQGVKSELRHGLAAAAIDVSCYVEFSEALGGLHFFPPRCDAGPIGGGRPQNKPPRRNRAVPKERGAPRRLLCQIRDGVSYQRKSPRLGFKQPTFRSRRQIPGKTRQKSVRFRQRLNKLMTGKKGSRPVLSGPAKLTEASTNKAMALLPQGFTSVGNGSKKRQR